jgi:AAA15 family ATPase/GTPase
MATRSVEFPPQENMILKSLQIKNFRSLKNLDVGRVGQLNLIVGKNNSGKSTVLEALRIYAANGIPSVLRDIAESHDEKYDFSPKDSSELDGTLRFQHFFSGRQFPSNEDESISIGEINSEKSLRIQHAYLMETEEVIRNEDGDSRTEIRRKRLKKSEIEKGVGENITQALQVFGKGRQFNIYLQRKSGFENIFALASGASQPCSYVPTQFVSMDQLADDWDKVALTEYGQAAKDALRIIAPEFEDIVFVKKQNLGDNSTEVSASRTANVKLKGVEQVVPLNSMGDGMVRVLQLVMKVFSAKNGFLLIDEFENGLHYSVQEKVWNLLFDLAAKLNIQVFATTHSWDCIESFAKVAVEKTHIDGVLFRVGRSVRTSDKGEIVATVFDEDKLATLTQADVEVR